MNTDTPTTISLIVLTLLSLAAWFVALARARRVARGEDPQTLASLQTFLVGLCIALGGGLFIYRTVAVHRAWQPLEAHVDGLILIGVLLAVTVTYLVKRGRMKGLSLFALPFLAVTFAWAICASWWTFYRFETDRIHSAWKMIHLSSVYGGMLFFIMAAIAGGMYLHVQRTLHRSHDPTATRPFASLEAIETLIVRTSALGFALLSLGLVTGLIIVTGGETRLGPGWWYSSKVLLAGAAWLIYAVVMNVRHTTHFRGARAAWLSIAGLVLLLATFGIATALPSLPKQQSRQNLKSEISNFKFQITDLKSQITDLKSQISDLKFESSPSLRASVPSCLRAFPTSDLKFEISNLRFAIAPPLRAFVPSCLRALPASTLLPEATCAS